MKLGTSEGVSIIDGSTWESFNEAEDLISNNLLCMAVNTDGSVCLSTDNGISHFNGSTWTNFQTD